MRMSLDEFLQLEEQAEATSDFWEGRIRARTPVYYRESLIAVNLLCELREKEQDVLGSNLLVEVTPGELVAYSDGIALIDEPQFTDSRELVLTNPGVLFEVVSAESSEWDRGEKARHYRGCPTLRQFTFVNAETPEVEVWTRGNDGNWCAQSWQGLDTVCSLDSLNCRVSLAEIYDGVKFSDTQSG